jgi:hypothetical protein
MTLKKGLICAAVIALGAALVFISNIFFNDSNPADNRQPVYPITKTIRYSFFLQNTTPRLIKNAQFWTYAPVKQTSTQLCSKIKASHPYDLITDAFGNQVLHFTFDDLAPYASKIITIKATLLLSDQANRLPEEDMKIYLGAEKYIETRDSHIRHLSKQLRSETAAATAKNIFNWVSANLAYAGYIKQAYGARYALLNKKGDCTEFMYLFAALSRAGNLPARSIGGYICRESTILKPAGYHNWAEFYEKGVWRLADPQKRVFDTDYASYIAMRIIHGPSDGPMHGFDRFRVAGDGLRVRMRSRG